MALQVAAKLKLNIVKDYIMKIHHEHVESHLKEHDGGMAGNQHEHEKMEKHLKEHDGGMQGFMHEHEKVAKLCGGGKTKK